MKIGEMIDAYMWKHKQSLRATAREIGVSVSTLSRITNGKDCDMKSLTLILVWMMT